jgi:hypothetical protein
LARRQISAGRFSRAAAARLPPAVERRLRALGELRLVEDPIDPYRFLTHSVERDGSPILGGLLLRCVFPVIAKNWTWTQWSKLLDLVGGGISDVTFDPLLGGNLTNAQRVAETTGRQLWAAMSSAYKIQRHFPDGRAAGHKDFHYEANAAISEVLTGARLTTDQGEKGARSLGVVHQDELDDLRAGDAEDLAETITAQLLVPLIAINFGPQERYPRFRCITMSRPTCRPSSPSIAACTRWACRCRSTMCASATAAPRRSTPATMCCRKRRRTPHHPWPTPPGKTRRTTRTNRPSAAQR